MHYTYSIVIRNLDCEFWRRPIRSSYSILVLSNGIQSTRHSRMAFGWRHYYATPNVLWINWLFLESHNQLYLRSSLKRYWISILHNYRCWFMLIFISINRNADDYLNIYCISSLYSHKKIDLIEFEFNATRITL